jgi:hypothetical protein
MTHYAQLGHGLAAAIGDRHSPTDPITTAWNYNTFREVLPVSVTRISRPEQSNRCELLTSRRVLNC